MEMLGTTQLNAISFADNMTFNDGYMKRAFTRQRMSIKNNNNKRNKFDTSENSGLLSYPTTVTLKFKSKQTFTQYYATSCDSLSYHQLT